MTEELLKDAKIIRRNAKAALTRASKSLRHLIQSKRPGKEVSDVLFKVQKAYETLIDKHEEFTKLIEDDKEFEEQEAWLEESQYMFMSLETDTKLYLESTKEVQKEFKDRKVSLVTMKLVTKIRVVVRLVRVVFRVAIMPRMLLVLI